MIIHPIKTRALIPPKDDLLDAIRRSITSIKEETVLVITSKVVSIHQGRCVPMRAAPDKDALIIQEAEKYLPRDVVPGKWIMHTIKEKIFIPTAGIDESNANEHYILWPEHPRKTAYDLWKELRNIYGIKKFGVIITDSHTIPLRRGVVGIALAFYGFNPLKDYRGTADIFGRTMQITLLDIVDSIATAAVAVMGEGNECTPLATVQDNPLVFFEHTVSIDDCYRELDIDEKEDLYYPFLSSVPWQKGGSQ